MFLFYLSIPETLPEPWQEAIDSHPGTTGWARLLEIHLSAGLGIRSAAWHRCVKVWNMIRTGIKMRHGN